MTDENFAPTSPRERLAALLLEHDMVPAAAAQLTLGVGDSELRDLLRSGQLDGVQVRGRLYVERSTLRVVSQHLLEARAEDAMAAVEPMAAALRALLAEHPAVLRYDRARGGGVPLVLARRGGARGENVRADLLSRHGATSLYGHDVALPASAVSRFVESTDRPPPDAELLPVGPALIDRYLLLDGITEQGHVTPADPGDRRSRRVHRWLRIDTSRWSVTCDADTLAVLHRLAVGAPS